jgi:hypothetical protein
MPKLSIIRSTSIEVHRKRHWYRDVLRAVAFLFEPAGDLPAMAKAIGVTVTIPPTRTRFWFWAVGKRPEPLYRPWVAVQIARPDYTSRRLLPVLVIQTVFYVIPQTLLALAAHSRLRLIVPLVILGFNMAYAIALTSKRKPLREATRNRLLAYYGVTCDGKLVPPVSAWSANPLGRTGLALLMAQILVFSSGVAVAADMFVTQRACKVPRPADLAALSAAVGQSVLGLPAGSGAFTPIVAPGTRLLDAREVDTALPNVRYVAAYLTGPSGHLLGPAVWRIIDPLTYLNPGNAISVDARDSLARQITPTTGYGSSQPVDPELDQTRDCAESARR